MNSWNGRGGARPGLVSATDGRVGLSVELDEALGRVGALGRSVATAKSHEQRAAELKEIIGEARRALVVSTSLASAEGESGVVPKRSHPPASLAVPTEWLLRSVVHDLNNML